jgi:hypothetical protein
MKFKDFCLAPICGILPLSKEHGHTWVSSVAKPLLAHPVAGYTFVEATRLDEQERSEDSGVERRQLNVVWQLPCEEGIVIG